MIKKQIIKNLRTEVFCRLQASPIHEVGVFCIKPIPAETNPFPTFQKEKFIPFKKSEIMDDKEITNEVKKMIQDFFVEDTKKIYISSLGLNGMNISQFLNHSKKSNVKWIERSQIFKTKRKIKPGEELTVDYSEFSAI